MPHLVFKYPCLRENPLDNKYYPQSRGLDFFISKFKNISLKVPKDLCHGELRFTCYQFDYIKFPLISRNFSTLNDYKTHTNARCDAASMEICVNRPNINVDLKFISFS